MVDMLKSAIAGRVSRNSHAFVVHELGKAIVNGELKVGTLLPGDAELAERFSVSRTVLREAMKTLAAKGLVFARARIGTRVTERTAWNFFDADVLTWHLEYGLDSDFLTHLSEMRLAFEPYAARLAARHATSEDIARMYEHAEAMRTASSTEAVALADLALHMAVLDASRNPFMYSVGNLIEAALVTSFQLSSPFGDPARQRGAALAHRAIVEAIEAGDPDAAAKATERVIIEGLDRVAKTMG
ncbi:FadR/GntR family transcriptional regulator [Breoghania sp. L-A4]|uniref:FadR/GntR family transcriptional regulator n=1 Tax=Breoghania sp. L-A4 TaxID=2304600 RepID=UPI000E35A1BA|nr:FadR/GntR family transcriptional regulator [Breoghania sp. L-A4]AXS41604.1 FadR family transcriptional regulator [Breoghania sp. L-A4]